MSLGYAILFWTLIEALLVFVFFFVAKWLTPRETATTPNAPTADEAKAAKPGKIRMGFTSWFKGLIERLFLVFMLLAGFEGAAIVVFGAIKLGTRLDNDKDTKVSNDYFLIGNLLSIAAATGIYLLVKDFIHIV